MIEGTGWMFVALAVVGAAIYRLMRPTGGPAINQPVRRPDPTPTTQAQEALADAARAEIDGLHGDLEGDDPAGDIADAANRSRRRR